MTLTNTPDDDTIYSIEDIRTLLGGATLLRYSEGTDEHEGSTMAVFRRPDGQGIGLSMNNASTMPESVIGETVRAEAGIRKGTGFDAHKAFILFDGCNNASDKILIKNTANIGVYEVEVREDRT